jgi:hypothetical protein
MMQQYVGEFYSKEWISKNVLFLDEDQIKDMKDQIDTETKAGEIDDEDGQQQPDNNNNEPEITNQY